MGFFSDLKEDLSQAVNELMPDDGTVTEKIEAEKVVEEVKEVAEEVAEDIPVVEAVTAETLVEEESVAETVNGFDTDLSEMLDKVEEVAMPVEEEIYVAPVAAPQKTESMIINGNLATEGALDIRGSIVGNVEALGKLNITGVIQGNSNAAEIYAESAKITGELRSTGSIKVGQSTVIIGNVYATSAVIAGAVKGDIDVKGPVILDSSAIVMGDIKSKSVQINNGAVIEGMCSQCYAEVNPTSFFEELKKMK